MESSVGPISLLFNWHRCSFPVVERLVGDVGHPAPRLRMCADTQLIPHTLSGRGQRQGYLYLPSLIGLRELFQTADVNGSRFSNWHRQILKMLVHEVLSAVNWNHRNTAYSESPSKRWISAHKTRRKYGLTKQITFFFGLFHDTT